MPNDDFLVNIRKLDIVDGYNMSRFSRSHLWYRELLTWNQ